MTIDGPPVSKLWWRSLLMVPAPDGNSPPELGRTGGVLLARLTEFDSEQVLQLPKSVQTEWASGFSPLDCCLPAGVFSLSIFFADRF